MKLTYEELAECPSGTLFQDRDQNTFLKLVENDMYHVGQYEAVNYFSGKIEHISALEGPFNTITPLEICW